MIMHLSIHQLECMKCCHSLSLDWQLQSTWTVNQAAHMPDSSIHTTHNAPSNKKLH
jgi:hypothetical protein